MQRSRLGRHTNRFQHLWAITAVQGWQLCSAWLPSSQTGLPGQMLPHSEAVPSCCHAVGALSPPQLCIMLNKSSAAGHPRIILVTDMKSAFRHELRGGTTGEYRTLRPNSCQNPVTDVNKLRSAYSKVCSCLTASCLCC